MIDKIGTCITVIKSEGAIKALLAIGHHILPSPIRERLRFLRRCFKRSDWSDISPWSRVKSCWRGFWPKSYVVCDFNTYGSNYYLSDIDKEFCLHINEPHEDLLEDKALFHDVLDERGYIEYLPQLFGFILDGKLKGSQMDIISLLKREEKIVIKGRYGMCGRETYICNWLGDRVQNNAVNTSVSAFKRQMLEFDGFLATEFCEQADYAKTIYPGASNTIRLLTMNPNNEDPFIVRGVHRFGTHISGGMDNFAQGGLVAQISRGGRMGPAAAYQGGRITWHDTHPDTGSQITGVKIPRYDCICEVVESIMCNIPEFRYVGWDIIVSGDGLRIIEGNANPCTNLMQAHGPLLDNPKVLRFYRENGLFR